MTGSVTQAEVSQPAKRKGFNNNMMSSKRASVTHRPQTREVRRNFNEIPLHKEPINNILFL